MLLRGIRATKKSVLVTSMVCVLVFVVLLFTIFMIHNKQAFDSEKYLKKMQSLIESPNEVCLTDVFDFDFDKAYVAGTHSEVYGDEKYFLKKLGVETNVKIQTLESGGHNRILFIKDNVVVYDFVYEMQKMYIYETEQYVYPNTILILRTQGTVLCVQMKSES